MHLSVVKVHGALRYRYSVLIIATGEVWLASWGTYVHWIIFSFKDACSVSKYAMKLRRLKGLSWSSSTPDNTDIPQRHHHWKDIRREINNYHPWAAGWVNLSKEHKRVKSKCSRWRQWIKLVAVGIKYPEIVFCYKTKSSNIKGT